MMGGCYRSMKSATSFGNCYASNSGAASKLTTHLFTSGMIFICTSVFRSSVVLRNGWLKHPDCSSKNLPLRIIAKKNNQPHRDCGTPLLNLSHEFARGWNCDCGVDRSDGGDHRAAHACVSPARDGCAESKKF